MTRFFLSVYDYFSSRKSLLFTLLLVLIAVFLGLASQVRFTEDISRFLPADKTNERINRAYRYVTSSNKITIYCAATDSTDREQQMRAVDAFVERLQTATDTTQVKHILYKIDPAEMMSVALFVVENMPYYLDHDDYRRMDTLVTREALARQLEIDRNILTSSAGMMVRQHLLADPLQLTANLMRKLRDFQAGGRFDLYQDYIFSDDGQALIVVDCAIPASETSANKYFLKTLNACMRETEKAFDGISFHSFGAAEIALTNAGQIQRDTLLSSLFAVVIVLTLLIFTFRDGLKIGLIFASVTFGGLFALGLMHLIRGEVSIIAVGISSIMFGIAINYPLHFIGHHGSVPNSRFVIKDIIQPLTIGNITTVGAFMSLIFIGSDAMCDLGWFASLLLVGTILFVLLFLPHLLSYRGRKPASSHAPFGQFVDRPFEKNRWLVATIIVVTVLLAFSGGESHFEADMRKINYMTDTQQQEYERMRGLLNDHHHVLYYVTEGDTPEAALTANEESLAGLQELLTAGEISKIGGIGHFLPSPVRQTAQVKRWNDFWERHRDSVRTYLAEEGEKLGFRADAFHLFEEIIGRTWEKTALSHFDPIKETLARNYVLENDGKTMIVNLLYLDADKARSVEEKLNGQKNASLSIAFDAGSITRRMIASLSDNFNYVLYICGLIVFVFLLFSLGRLELTLIAFTPLALSWVWILGLMGLFDIKFNIVNIILATFIFGQGDDYTIFMTEGLMYEYTYRRKTLSSYKNSIALSAAIMFVGMGMLIFAKHPALRSLGEVTVVGMLSVVVMAYVFPPFLFGLLTMRKGRKRLMPVTLKNLLSTAYAFLVFLVASPFITLAGWGMATFGRTTEKKKMAYHRLLHRIARFVIYRIPQVKTTFSNLSGETFERPGVIICNHQSHLDLMCIMMLTPKLIILTNDWVWNSPFYGRLIRYADFYPVSSGIEQMIDRLRDAVDRGYSIVIFPEGTRSADCSILRFHRGAFYLAEQLQIDIIPVMIHGVGHVLPKQEFMLRKGEIRIQVMPRITPDDARFSPNYSQRAKEVRQFYRREYEAVCRKYETSDYYADLVKHNYIYKGPAVEREVRANLRKHHNYVAEIAALPDEGEVTIENTGYGEFALLLALVKKKLQIIAVEPDDDKRELAENCASVPPNLRYVAPTHEHCR